jgi:integrase
MKWRIIRPNKTNLTYRLQRSVDGKTWKESPNEQVSALNQLLSTLSSSAAEQRAKDILVQLRAQDAVDKPFVSPGNRQLVNSFLKTTYPDTRIKRISEESLRTLKYDLECMLTLLGDTPIEADPVRLQNYVDRLLSDQKSRHIKTTSCLNRIRATLGLPAIKHLVTEQEDIAYLSEDEVMELLRRAPEPFKTLIGVAFYTGMRKGEIFATGPEYLGKGYLRVEWQIKKLKGGGLKRTLPKGRKKRKAFIVPGGEEWLQRWFEMRDKVSRDIKVSEVCRSLAGVRFHDLRHSYVVHLITKGASLGWVAQSIGDTIKVCERNYASHVLQDDSITLLNNLLRQPERQEPVCPS